MDETRIRPPLSRRDFLLTSASLTAAGCLSARASEMRSLALDFTRGLPEGVAFRRDSPATLWDGERLVEVQMDTPRFVRSHGKVEGLLIEAASQNLLPSPSCLEKQHWSGKALSCEPTPLGAPHMSSAVALLSRTDAASGGQCAITAVGPAGAVLVTGSVWLRSREGAGTWGLLLRDATTYNATTCAVDVSTQWRRYSLSLDGFANDRERKVFALVTPAPGAETRPAQRVAETQRAENTRALTEVCVWGAQLEASGVATSYMVPGGSTRARAADEVRCRATLLNPVAGALTFELPRGGSPGGVLVDANGQDGGLYLGYTSSGWLEARVGPLVFSGDVPATSYRAVRLEWHPGGAALWVGASSARLELHTAQAGTVPALRFGDWVRLGASEDSARALNATLARVEIGERKHRAVRSTVARSFAPPRYELAFGDDFDDDDVSRINENAKGGSAKAPAWRSRYRHPRKDVINKEKQIYMDPAFAGTADHALGVQPFSIRDGKLCIQAERADPERVSPHIWNYRYTSGCITSELTHWQTYGYFEMRARLPLGKGFWPAFWMLPKAKHWPPEIDVFEASGTRPFAFRPAIAPPRGAKARVYGCWMRQLVGVNDGFHAYGVEWTADNIIFSVDGKRCFETGPHDIHEDMYLLANLALGSHDPNWIPDPDETTPFPGRFEIDWIRAYRRTNLGRARR